MILHHVFTIAGAVSSCDAASTGTSREYSAHMVATVLTAIFQGSVSSSDVGNEKFYGAARGRCEGLAMAFPGLISTIGYILPPESHQLLSCS
ncbi:uncharacterized protein G2W53_000912 [Senna tora]|uniref:Uncharacterized protein n=1 Tax=Senna tora TaxID=362788 RepID=A0A835CM30_9FABA|nr:uncharacterized protein G2W53_000912 [Senna tora]